MRYFVLSVLVNSPPVPLHSPPMHVNSPPLPVNISPNCSVSPNCLINRLEKVEDWAVATVLDPRFKALDFPLLEMWRNGKFTREKALSFTKTAWGHYKPKARSTVVQPTTTNAGTQSKGNASFDAFMLMSQVCV